MVVSLLAVDGACTGSIGDQLGQGPKAEIDACSPVGPAPLRRLSAVEYNLAVRDLFGDTSNPASIWPAAGSSTGFDNDVIGQSATSFDIEAFIGSAEAVADGVLKRLPAVLPCDRATLANDAQRSTCADTYISALARRAFRRPATQGDRTRLRAAYDRGFAVGGFEGGIRAIVETTLESASFLYKLETGAGVATNGAIALSDYEVASRLSFFITGTIPDEDLLSAADEGALMTREGVEEQTRRLLDTPAARARVREFFRQLLRLDRVLTAEKDASVIAGFDSATRRDLLLGTEAFAEYVLFDAPDRTLEALLTAPYTFATKRTAPLYGATSTAETPTRLELDPARRAGIVTDAGLLAGLAKMDQSSPIARGVFVRTALLCQPLGAPPNAEVATPPEPDPTKTTRERFAAHTANDTCAGCHRLIDPIGFGLESFDAAGRYRASENGIPVDTKGNLIGTDVDGPFDGAIELARKLADSSEVSACIADRWLMFAQGRNVADECMRPALQARFATSSGDFEDLIIAIATDDAFRTLPGVDSGSCK